MKNNLHYPRIRPLRIQNHLEDSWFEIKEAFTDYRFYRTNIITVIGCIMVAYAVNTVLLPLNLISPGFTGLSMGIYYLSHIGSVSVIYTILNIPLFFLGWRMVSGRYLLINILGTIYFTLALIYVKGFTMPVEDVWMQVFLGALIGGGGGGLYLRYGGAIGGLDIVAFLFKKKLSIPMGSTFFLLNCCNLVLNFFAYDLKVTLYSAIYIFIQSYIVHKAQNGFSQTSVVMIISKLHKEIAERLVAKLGRSFTYLRGVGGYSQQEMSIIYLLVNQFELARIKEVVHKLDPKALLSVLPTSEVIGQQFLSWEEEGFVEKTAKKRSRLVEKSMVRSREAIEARFDEPVTLEDMPGFAPAYMGSVPGERRTTHSNSEQRRYSRTRRPRRENTVVDTNEKSPVRRNEGDLTDSPIGSEGSARLAGEQLNLGRPRSERYGRPRQNFNRPPQGENASPVGAQPLPTSAPETVEGSETTRSDRPNFRRHRRRLPMGRPRVNKDLGGESQVEARIEQRNENSAPEPHIPPSLPHKEE